MEKADDSRTLSKVGTALSVGKRREGEPEGILQRIVWHFDRKRQKIANRLIRRRLGHAATSAELGWQGKVLLFYFRNLSSNHKALPLIGYGQIARASVPLARAVKCLMEAPCAPGGTPKLVENHFPAMEAWIFDDAVSAAMSSSIVAGNRVGVPEFYMKHASATIADGEFLLCQCANGAAIIRHKASPSQPAGLMLFGSGSSNWYHWLIETLPAAFLSQKLPGELASLPLYIPAEISELSSFRDSLEIFRNGREVRTLGPGLHRFDTLIRIDSPVREPMNLRRGFWPEIRDYACNFDLLREYRKEILDQLGLTNVQRGKRLFLARANGRRSYNQGELLSIAQRFGFHPVYPEQLSFREQVELLARASHVVGPSGAAFANTLFCQPGTRLLSWLPPQYSDFCSYTNVARTTDSTLRYLSARLEQPIQSSFDVYSATYHVDSDEFETALRLALNSSEY